MKWFVVWSNEFGVKDFKILSWKDKIKNLCLRASRKNLQS